MENTEIKEEDMIPFRSGIYRHFKGGMYSVLGVAQHTETGEYLVVYLPTDHASLFWVRPLSMFTEEVEYNGVIVPRFEFVENG
jgi:hypothetical protein